MDQLIKIEERHGQIVTTSRNVAEVFRKQHKNVLKAIEKAINEVEEDFGRLNFELSSYTNEQNKVQPEYIMTQDGWSFVVMGFTGKKASKFKQQYIKMFNKMREKLSTNPQQLSTPKNYIQALEALLISEKEKEKAQQTVAILTHVKKTYTATEIAKELGLSSAQELNSMMERDRIQYKSNDTWVLYSPFTGLGYEHIKQEVLDSGRIVYHRKWTQRGREFILETYKEKLKLIENGN